MNQKDIILLFGAGASSGAWEPIFREFNLEGEEFNKSGLRGYLANGRLAHYVHMARFYHHYFEQSDGQKLREAAINELDGLKSRIASGLGAAIENNEIKVRAEFMETVNQIREILPIGGKIYFVTTNWEKSVETKLQELFGASVEVVYFHGNIDDPQTLYLPSETSFEPYLTTHHRAKMQEMNAFVANAGDQVERMVIFGLSLDPLDSELCWTLSPLLRGSKLKTVDIVDLEPKRVGYRLWQMVPDMAEKLKIRTHQSQNIKIC